MGLRRARTFSDHARPRSLPENQLAPKALKHVFRRALRCGGMDPKKSQCAPPKSPIPLPNPTVMGKNGSELTMKKDRLLPGILPFAIQFVMTFLVFTMGRRPRRRPSGRCG